METDQDTSELIAKMEMMENQIMNTQNVLKEERSSNLKEKTFIKSQIADMTAKISLFDSEKEKL